MNNQNRRLGVAALLLVVVIPAAAAIYMYSRTPSEPLAIGAQCPSFRVADLEGAGGLRDSGRRVMVFFRPSCPHCRRLLSQVDELKKAHPEWSTGSTPLEWELISTASRKESEEFARTGAVPVHLDEDGEAMRTMHGISVPYLVLVDEQSKVRYTQTGERSLAYHETLIDSFSRTGKASADSLRVQNRTQQ